MKNICIVLFFYVQIGVSQDSNLSIVYQAQLKEMDTSFLKDKSDYVKNQLASQFEAKKTLIKKIKFELICSDSDYFLFYNPPIATDDFFKYRLTGAVSRVFDANYILVDKSNDQAILAGFESGVKIDRLVDMNSIKWEETQEEKVILEYICKKYIGTLKDESYAHKGHYPIVAWVTNAISYSCGPTPFGNINGVILELENNDSIVTATSINPTEKSIPEYKSEFRLLPYPDYINYMEEWSKKNMPRKN